MRTDQLGWGGLVLVGLVAGMGLPKLLSLGRKAARRATGVTYRTGVSSTRPGADPARGIVT